MSSTDLIIGLMSGTSVDGIDAALVEFTSDKQLKVIETQFTPFEQGLREQINALALKADIQSVDETPLHTELAEHYAQASLSLLAKSGHKPDDISAIANHGQTVRHEPNASPPYSLQLGDGQLIANRTGITTITQFRQADLACGGQGAPLMPAFHKAIFSHSKNEQDSKPGLILNIGGIANLTSLEEPVIGFDTGPGNTIMDQWVARHQGKQYDADGQWAKSGKVLKQVLHALLEDVYFTLPAPKSSGPDYFNLMWLEQRVPELEQYAPEDVQATLLALTVESIAASVKQLSIAEIDCASIYVCGGGAHNSALMQALGDALKESRIDKTDALGVPSDWVESVGFAWLAYCKLHDINSSIPSVTGAIKAQVLGKCFNAIS